MRSSLAKQYLFVCLATPFSFASAHAAGPVWTFTPLTATTLSIASTATATVQYTLTNQSKKTHTLVLTPVAGLTQNTAPGNCAAPAVLAYGQSCTLTINIAGSELSGNLVGGPEVCEHGRALQCYRPSQANSLNITLTHQSAYLPMVVGGQYFSDDLNNTLYPLLAMSTNGGLNWTYTIDSSSPTTQPANYDNYGLFNTTSCSSNNCIAAGQYNDGTTTYPLLATSTQDNASWIYTIDSTTLPSNYDSLGIFNASSCSDSTCIAAGKYVINISGTNQYPLLANSSDGGLSWVYAIDSSSGTLPQDYSSGGEFNGASCSGNNCIAAGQYSNINSQYPLLAASSDGGTTWVDKIDSNSSTNFINGAFTSASCNGENCIAAGGYNFASLPLLAASSNGGASWTYQIDATSPTLPSGFTNGNFSGASCSDQHCIAGGFYNNNSETYPLLAARQNNGSWSYTMLNFTDQAFINSVSCNGTHCIAAGAYSLAPNRPFLADSTDGGFTWTYPSFTIPNFDSNNNSQLLSASCNSTTCIAAGFYTNSTTNQTTPIVITSINSSDWIVTIDNSSPSLPDNFLSGQFNSASTTIASLMPAALRLNDDAARDYELGKSVRR